MKKLLILQPGIELWIAYERMGDDLTVAVYGGDRPHIGSIAIAIPRPSLSDAAKFSATTSVVNVTGHKDDVVGAQVASALSARLRCVVSVSCGIHFDNITSNQLQVLMQAPGVIVAEILHNLPAPSSND